MPNFKTLWDNFPDSKDMKEKCQNKQEKSTVPFDNYCAILMSECFLRSGIDLSACPAKFKCWSHPSPKHLTLAENLAAWLKKSPPSGFGKSEKIESTTFQKKLSGRTGVIFFKDYWQRTGETNEGRSGDHIDLWNKSRITESSMLYRDIVEFFGFVSDLNKSREIWFWEVK